MPSLRGAKRRGNPSFLAVKEDGLPRSRWSLAMTKSKQRAHRNGLRAELVALICLTLKGYWLVSWRTKTPVGEIDLVMRRGKTLVFVEVKARAVRADAAHAIHGENQSRVVRAAQYFLRGHPNYTACDIRFDAVLIAWYRWPHHIQNAFW
jgi:putative endonuclease